MSVHESLELKDVHVAIFGSIRLYQIHQLHNLSR